MSTDVLTRITDADVEAFQRDGAVCLRGVFDASWIARVAAGVEKNLAAPSPYAKFYTPKDTPGFFFGDYCNWSRIPELRDYVLHSPAAATAARLMRARTVRIFHDHLLVKEPGTTERTPWHHDLPYYCIDGTQICSIWLPLDPVARDTAIEFVAGSHAWGQSFTPRRFVDHRNYDYEPGVYAPVPDIDGERDRYRILGWEMAPGDCVVFHGLTLHGAPGNLSLERRRRAFSTRWMGDDIVYATRPGTTSPPFPELEGKLRPGDPMDHELFPVVWREDRAHA
jgi:ectoine hydroxylase-related dioxygenase (phytanoyl-CoA dioxygenase family)